ncbi:MAG: hypothetical protein ISS25_00445 [Nanoarchaeota archaeon]|nr:hypothetical protein [DPANN group archaeon]MBL7116286.1 hypothetical protein [Nanoarchaeota archaeon]
MKFQVIFFPLKEKKTIKVFLLSTIIIAIVYVSFSIILSLLSTRPLPEGSMINILLFTGFKAFSGFNVFDWVILGLFPIIGGLLYANYSYWKCKANKAANVGLVAGLLAATCPACILPVVGISSFIAFLTKISIYIKIVALLVLVWGTFYVANIQCKTK